jgi:archaeal flagellar protein FlaJ
MRLKKMHWFGIIAASFLIVIDLFAFLNKEDLNLFIFLIGIASGILFLPFVIGIILENKKDDERVEMFLEFSRNLSESVAIGTPVSKSIVIMRKKNYGFLTPHIQKLANQISLGIPVGSAFRNFASDVGSPIISRAIALIREAERAGGEIDYILDSVAKSIAEVSRLKKERKAAISSIVVQGYIIFFIFIGIMLVMQFKIVPLTANVGIGGGFSVDSITEVSSEREEEIESFSQRTFARPFLYLLLAQGLLAGLTIGKLAEGRIKAGIKHSAILASSAFLISSGATLFLS